VEARECEKGEGEGER
jgi:hypothetical protein